MMRAGKEVKAIVSGKTSATQKQGTNPAIKASSCSSLERHLMIAQKIGVTEILEEMI